MPPKAISTKPYADIGRAGKPPAQRRRILDEFRLQQVPLNRRMIGELTGLPINVVCWRVKGMLDSGLLEIVGELKDPITDQDTEVLYPTGAEFRIFQFEFNL